MIKGLAFFKKYDKSGLKNNGRNQNAIFNAVQSTFSHGGYQMPHNYSAHTRKFRQREFWLPHESPKNRQHVTRLLYALLIIGVLLILISMNDKDTTDYATIDQVSKIETHLFQLEERLVWTDEKIDTMQAVAEAAAMQALEDNNKMEMNSSIEQEPELKEPESPVLADVPVEKTPVEAITEIITTKAPEAPPKEVPVLQPKIKKKKIKRREFGIIYKYHKVRHGETLYRIGLKYNVPVTEIRRLNHLQANESIHPGQRLLVSQGER